MNFTNEFMVDPVITQNAEFLATWKPKVKKGFFGTKKSPPPKVLTALFITSHPQEVAVMDGEVKIGEVTVAPNTAILSMTTDGYVEAFVLLNTVIYIANSKKKKDESKDATNSNSE